LAVARAAYASGYKGESNEVIAFDLSESQDKSANISEKFKEAVRKFC
jgi:hypothetical protein